MSLLPPGASFAERVQECFLAFRGSGLMLSALDTELIEQWARLEVPFEVVARGIRRAAEHARWDEPSAAPGLRSLRACKRQVDAEIKKYLGRAIGRGQSPDEESSGQGRAEPNAAEKERHRKLIAELEKLARSEPALREAVHQLLAGPLRAPPADPAQSLQQEEHVYARLLRGLPFEERVRLVREARLLTERSPMVSWRAKRDTRRFHRGALIRRRLCLPFFW